MIAIQEKTPIRQLQSSLQQQEQMEPWLWCAAGGTLLGLGLARRSLIGSIAAAAGAGLLYYGIQQFRGSPSGESGGLFGFRRQSRPQVETRPVTCSVVELASWESFPASDPPGYTRRRN